MYSNSKKLVSLVMLASIGLTSVVYTLPSIAAGPSGESSLDSKNDSSEFSKFGQSEEKLEELNDVSVLSMDDFSTFPQSVNKFIEDLKKAAAERKTAVMNCNQLMSKLQNQISQLSKPRLELFKSYINLICSRSNYRNSSDKSSRTVSSTDRKTNAKIFKNDCKTFESEVQSTLLTLNNYKTLCTKMDAYSRTIFEIENSMFSKVKLSSIPTNTEYRESYEKYMTKNKIYNDCVANWLQAKVEGNQSFLNLLHAADEYIDWSNTITNTPPQSTKEFINILENLSKITPNAPWTTYLKNYIELDNKITSNYEKCSKYKVDADQAYTEYRHIAAESMEAISYWKTLARGVNYRPKPAKLNNDIVPNISNNLENKPVQIDSSSDNNIVPNVVNDSENKDLQISSSASALNIEKDIKNKQENTSKSSHAKDKAKQKQQKRDMAKKIKQDKNKQTKQSRQQQSSLNQDKNKSLSYAPYVFRGKITKSDTLTTSNERSEEEILNNEAQEPIGENSDIKSADQASLSDSSSSSQVSDSLNEEGSSQERIEEDFDNLDDLN